jgi:hypothetical protein
MATAQNYGVFAPTTNVWDVSQINNIEGLKPELKELLVRLYQNLNIMSLVLNAKDTGYYNTQEIVNSQQWFPNPLLSSAPTMTSTAIFRPVLRTVINFGALPNAAAKTARHHIFCSSQTTFTRIYATASDTTGLTYIPIPYASTTAVANNIEIKVDNTNVTITTAANYSNYNVCYVVLEYLQT